MKRALLIFCVSCAPAVTKQTPQAASQAASVPEMQTDANTALASSLPAVIPPPTTTSPAKASYEAGLQASSSDAALKDFEAAIAADPHFCEAHTAAGVLYERRREADVAAERYQKGINDGCGSAYRALMLLQLRQGHTHDAELTVRGGLAKHPNDAALRLGWAEFLTATGQFVQAEKEALAVMHVDEKNAGAMLVLARAYYAEKKFELSRFAAENARDVDPQNAEAYHQLGVLFLQKNQHAQALTAFRKATELRPDAYASQINLSELLTEAGDFDGALVAAEAALAFVPEAENARLVHANALRGVGRFRDAESEYRKLLDKNPRASAAVYNLGILYLDAEIDGLELDARLQKAIDEFNLYLTKFKPPTEEAALVGGYIAQAKRQIEAEQKRKDRELKRAAKKATPQPASAPTPK